MTSLSILLTIVFVVLQISGIVNWAWYIILSPIFIGLIFDLLFGLGVLIAYFVIKRKNKD